MKHEYTDAQAWVDAAATFRGQGETVLPADDPMTRQLGFCVGGQLHFITLGTARVASPELKKLLLTPAGRFALLGGTTDAHV